MNKLPDLIEIKELSKKYKLNNLKNLVIINNLSIKIKYGCNICILGPSGSGKSTFLNILGLLDNDFQGEYLFAQKNIKKIGQNEINKTRGMSIGFVHQFFHLIPELSVIENVMLPHLINQKLNNAYDEAKKLLDIFGLNERINFKPKKLSGGEQQRVAIARSLINNPELILADEMTGNLDENTADEIFLFFLNYIRQYKKSLIFVTHNKKYSKKADEIYFFNNKILNKNDE